MREVQRDRQGRQSVVDVAGQRRHRLVADLADPIPAQQDLAEPGRCRACAARPPSRCRSRPHRGSRTASGGSGSAGWPAGSTSGRRRCCRPSTPGSPSCRAIPTIRTQFWSSSSSSDATGLRGFRQIIPEREDGPAVAVRTTGPGGVMIVVGAFALRFADFGRDGRPEPSSGSSPPASVRCGWMVQGLRPRADRLLRHRDFGHREGAAGMAELVADG